MSAQRDLEKGAQRDLEKGAQRDLEKGAQRDLENGAERGRALAWYRYFWPWALIAISLAGVAVGTVVAVYGYRNADIEIVRTEAVPLDKTSWQRKAVP